MRWVFSQIIPAKVIPEGTPLNLLVGMEEKTWTLY